ncbi:hypothetical protein V1477_001272 [Vespula maculifrons]|uniref:Uncharacterized protein n=3 Tax=Vespula TaxID=7451 RepID=A0A834MZ82_VESPE|nr:hypothetical protein HZH66_014877 [Vespula vulgaris]KAF7390557.1 hypothetical protein H0235_017719 [Vespula pensylvanica]
MYSTEPTGSLVTLGGHLRVVLHSHDDATVAAESTDPPSSLANEYGGRGSLRKSFGGSKNGVDGPVLLQFSSVFDFPWRLLNQESSSLSRFEYISK